MIACIFDVHAHPHQQYNRLTDDGVSSRLSHCVTALQWALDDAYERGCRSFIIGGDLHHDRDRVPVPVLFYVGHVLESNAARYKDRVLLVGNHDLHRAGTTHSLRPYAGLCRIVEAPETIPVGKLKLGMLPFTDSADDVNSFVSRNKRADAFIAHVGLDSAKVGPSDFEMPGHIKADQFGDKTTLLGHYHKHAEVDEKRVYGGALLQHTRGERNDLPGYLILHDDRNWEHIENDRSPRFYHVTKLPLPREVTEADYVKVTLTAEQSEQADEAPKFLRDTPGAIEVVEEAPPMDDGLENLSALDDHEILMRWLARCNVEESKRASFAAAGMRLLSGAAA